MLDSSSSGNVPGGKFKLVNEIREKTKALREADEKIETLKRRETQIRETCEAWKKEVDVVREVSDEGIKQLKFQHEEEMLQLRQKADAHVKRLKAENDDVIGKNAVLLRENEQLRAENQALSAQPQHFTPRGGHGGFRGNFRGNGPRGGGGGGSNRGGFNNRGGPSNRGGFQNSNQFNQSNQQQANNGGFVQFGNKAPDFDQKAKRVYSPGQDLKRKEKLLDRLIKKAAEQGVPFVPDQGGALAELYNQKIAAGLLPKPT